MARATAAAAPRVYIARSSGVVKIKGVIHRYIRGRTVPADSPLVRTYPDRFELVDLGSAGVVIGHEVSEPDIQA